MLVLDNEVMFFETDMRFVKRFGLEAATDMVLDYSAINKTPFIYDFFQLSSFLRILPSDLRKLLDDIPGSYRSLQIPKKSGGYRELNQPLRVLRLSGIPGRADPQEMSFRYVSLRGSRARRQGRYLSV